MKRNALFLGVILLAESADAAIIRYNFDFAYGRSAAAGQTHVEGFGTMEVDSSTQSVIEMRLVTSYNDIVLTGSNPLKRLNDDGPFLGIEYTWYRFDLSGYDSMTGASVDFHHTLPITKPHSNPTLVLDTHLALPYNIVQSGGLHFDYGSLIDRYGLIFYGFHNKTVLPSAPVAEPSTVAIMGLGLAAFGFRRRNF